MSKTKTKKRPQTLVPEKYVDFNYELTQGFAANYIRRKARELARQPGYTRTDCDDLRQQMCVRVLERLPQFNPSQGCFNAFIKLIVKQFATDCRRHVRAKMRDRRNDASLNMLVDGEEGPLELVQTIGRRELNARLSREERSPQEAIDLSQDLAGFLAALLPRQRTIAERLKISSPSQIARELKVHCSTVYRDIQRLRDQFAKAGFHEYLQSMRQRRSRQRTSPSSDTTKDQKPSPEVSPMPCCSRRNSECSAPETVPVPRRQQAADVNFIVHEPAAAYHARAGEYLTSHLLADFRKCPLLYHRKREGLLRVRDDCPAYLVGHATHTVILEGEDAFRQQYAVGGPVNPQTSWREPARG